MVGALSWSSRTGGAGGPAYYYRVAAGACGTIRVTCWAGFGWKGRPKSKEFVGNGVSNAFKLRRSVLKINLQPRRERV